MKGLPDPVETVEVLWEPLGGADAEPVVPLPGASGRASRGGCRGPGSRDGGDVGCVQACRRGRRPRGVPRSRVRPVWARPRWSPRRPGPRSTAGRACCSGIAKRTSPRPYQLFAEALGHFVTHAPEEQLVAHVDAHGSELARLVPALVEQAAGPAAVDGDRCRHRALPAVRRGGGAAGHGVAASAGRGGAGRPAVGRQGEPAAARAT